MIYIYQDDTTEKTLIISSLDNCKQKEQNSLNKYWYLVLEYNFQCNECSSY